MPRPPVSASLALWNDPVEPGGTHPAVNTTQGHCGRLMTVWENPAAMDSPRLPYLHLDDSRELAPCRVPDDDKDALDDEGLHQVEALVCLGPGAADRPQPVGCAPASAGPLTTPRACPIVFSEGVDATSCFLPLSGLFFLRSVREGPASGLLGSSTKANHPQGWDAKLWVPLGLPGCRKVSPPRNLPGASPMLGLQLPPLSVVTVLFFRGSPFLGLSERMVVSCCRI